MEKLRIKINLAKPGFSIPISYQSILQGTIYALLSKSDLGDLYHDQGYIYQQKKFKCFVFSQLFGKYTIAQNHLCFENHFFFYISSQDERFLQELYHTLMNNEYLFLNKKAVQIIGLELENIQPFHGEKEITIHTLSPLLIYSTHDRYSTYYKPSDELAQKYILQNLHDKSKAYGYPIEHIIFDIKQVCYEKSRLVKFKNCIYQCYMAEMVVETNFETLLFIYNCGLSSKGSCGFGMIEIKNEKNHISI